MNKRALPARTDAYKTLINFLQERIAPYIQGLDPDQFKDVLEYTIAAFISNCYSVNKLRDRDLVSKATITIIRRIRALFSTNHLLGEQCERFLTEGDFRKRIVIITDETPLKKWGETIFASGPVWDNRVKRVINGTHIVTVLIMVGDLQLVYRSMVYIPREECEERGIPFKRKVDLAREGIKDLKEIEILRERIEKRAWMVADAQYQQLITEFPHPLGFAKGVGQVEADRQVKVGDDWVDLSEKLGEKQRREWGIEAPGVKTKKVSWKRCQVDLKTGGRMTAFAVEQGGKWRYYVTANRNVSTRTVLSVIRQRWGIEPTFWNLKQHFGFERGYIRKEASIRAFPRYSSFIFNLFSLFTWKMRAFCCLYDTTRAPTFSSFPSCKSMNWDMKCSIASRMALDRLSYFVFSFNNLVNS